MTPRELAKLKRERIAARDYASENEVVEHERAALTKRFGETVERVGECWVRRGAKTPVMWWAGRVWFAYRLAYALWHGDAPQGWDRVVHHRCENRLCLNPLHLVVLTKSEHAAEHQRLDAARGAA